MAGFTSSSRRLLIATPALLAAAAAALVFAHDQPAGAASGKTLKLSADPSGKLKFTKSKLTTVHGKVTLVMANPSRSGKPHAIALEGHGIDKDGKTVSPGGTSRVSVTLKKGTYEFYCPVSGHKAAGMEGKLVVK
jgi:plastocyanin